MKELLRQIYDDLANGRLSQREALERVRALKLEWQNRRGTLFVRPVWQSRPLADPTPIVYERRHAIVIDLPGVDLRALPDRQSLAIATDPEKNIAERYTDAAVRAFEYVQEILQSQPRGSVLVQIVVADDLFAGLSGLLRTASLENPRIAGQVLLVGRDLSTDELVDVLRNEQGPDAVVRHQNGEREVLRWDELPEPAEEAPVAFQDDGVYLITGGAGRLGGLFAREIVERTSARVVLTGRSPLSGSSFGDRMSYRQADLADGDQVTALIASIRNDYGRLDGIVHSAGILSDNFILKKSGDEFARVLAPKVAGTFHLDHATRDLDLDFFVLFSSVSGAAGGIGQSDYATANAFMDRFSAWRNEQVAAGRRHGRTRSINWSGWEARGMDADEASRERLRQTTGMQPMATETGLRAFHRCLTLPWDQIGVAEGDFARMRVALFSGRLIEQELAPLPAPVSAAPIERSTFVEKAREFLRNECAQVLGLQSHKIDPQAALENYGIDSILAVRLTTHLERTFGPLAKTLFFEYETIAELTGYFLESHSSRLQAVLASNEEEGQEETPTIERRVIERRSSRRSDRGRATVPAPAASREADPIAIIGLSGRYPEAIDLEAYWINLRDGKDCITEVPKERWDWQQYFSEDRTKSGHHYSKWGGFISGVDEFDPLFFNISPKDAKVIDPQERLFLQHAWMAVEDAGYTRAALQIADAHDLPGQVGVYVGVMYSEYQLFGAEMGEQGRRVGVAGSMASISNRVSYSLNLHGPSVTLDTMCSSSLTAIHFACLDLKQGRTSLAIAGGVNISIHPNKYFVLSQGQFISSDGHCQSFGEGGDGYIPGEGVGVVVLKRLSEAQRDGDHIYGVIRGSAVNHGGKTNGYTVPSPQAQAGVIRRALTEAGVDARHISYVEAHGTGTKLGDPIEIAALGKAFKTQDTAFCLLGSAKSNIGHCESAAGIAGLTKVLLQMQHRQIVPSLHSAQLNPNIDFEKTPFIVNQTLRPWEQPVIDGKPVARIAGISSFGAGGSNAHLVIEEYQAPAIQPIPFREVAIVLSARTAEQLRQKALDLLDFVRSRETTLDLLAMAYTLQVGREAMDERLGLVVKSSAQLIARLEAYLAGESSDVAQGQVRRDRDALSLFSTDAGLQQTVESWIANRELPKMLEFWVKGLDLDWERLYGRNIPPRISLPVYPFAKDRYWIDTPATPAARHDSASPRLHPLLHHNTSDLTQQSYRSRINEPLTAASYLEMARAAVQDAARVPRASIVELRDVRWAHPLPVAEELTVALLPDGGEEIRYEIYSHDGGEEVVHGQGRAVILHESLELHEPTGELLTRLRLPEITSDYVLHPALIEDALRAAAGDQVPVAIDSVRILSPCSAEMTAWLRRSPRNPKIDLDLCDAQENVCVRMRGIACEERPNEIAEPVTEQPVAERPRREIPLPQSPQAPVERKKRGAISLSAPGSVVATEPAPQKARLTLPAALPESTFAPSSVKVFDDGDGVFSIDLAAGSVSEGIVSLRHALDLVQAESAAKVLLLRGLERAFLGGRNEYNEAVERRLFEAIAAFPYPTIALLRGDAGGTAFMAAALCDFLVCNEDATYAYTDVDRNLDPTIPAQMLFAERFGDLAAHDFLYQATRASGRELRAKGWTCAILPGEEIESHAHALASALIPKSQEALRLLKQHLTRGLMDRVSSLTPIDFESASMPSDTDASADLVLELDSSLENVEETFAEACRSSACKAIVLHGDGDFLRNVAEDGRRRLQSLIVDAAVPVIAALSGNAKGSAWLVALCCDSVVYSRQGTYSPAGIGEDGAELFAYRFGTEAAREILLTGAAYSGSDLEQRVVALVATEPERVRTAALEIASSFAALPRPSLTDWKRHSATVLLPKISNVTPASPGESEQAELSSPAPVAISLQSNVVRATAHPGGIVVVKMEEREARNMFSAALVAGLYEAFEHIAQTPAYKVVVLTGYDSYFAAGGTKESLLAIQAGEMRFTDRKIFQLALDCKLPVIAAMQGHGLGAGWALGMFADVALLSEESRYVSPYMNYGFTPGAGATWILTEKMGQDLARESLLTAQPHTGRELQSRGLRMAVLRRAEVLPAAMALAQRMAGSSRARLIALKQQWTASVHPPLEETYQRELAMHDRTFVGRDDTAEKIRFDFYPDIADMPQAAAIARETVDRPAASGGSDGLRTVTASIRTLLAHELQMKEADVDENAQFVDLGLDSIGGVSLLRKVNEKYRTSIETTKIYSHPTLAQLARYVKDQAEQNGTVAVPVAPPAAPSAPRKIARPVAAGARRLTSWRNNTASRLAGRSAASQPQAIAVVGMAGQFPQARNVDEFWQNLAEGKNCITQVPAERWDLQTYFQPGGITPGKTNCPWVGALDEFDCFDPLFFNISPTEAENMDPQQRLFLQSCWHSIEHAGYDARALSGTKCGVFVGCAGTDYHDHAQPEQLSAHVFTGSATSILAARISYFLNLQGPCVAIDTACSSSLVAIAQACDSLNSGGSDVALAGGVYVMGGSSMHIMTAQAGMLSPEGKCYSFDQRADGFVPGEGVGVVMLKRLADAERDGDVIYGVIEGWGINQDGKTNGITAPNPESQTRLEQEVYNRYGIDPSHIQLIEAHGTGTKLGDPIEVEGLQKAFGKYTRNQQYCALGSVKSNIGHCLTAAGIAGVIKLLLALEHKQVPPTINFEQLNEHIDLRESPFYVNTQLQDWELRGAPRRLAGVSSFGFSGTNAHLVIGESDRPAAALRPAYVAPPNASVIVPLSARTPDQLREKARDLLHFLRKSPSVDLAEIAYTLQTGRTPMDERLGFVVTSIEQLAERLAAYVDAAPLIPDCHQGRVKRGNESLSLISENDDVRRAIVNQWISERNSSKLLELWVKGLDVDWNSHYDEVRPRRIALPLYPFAKERYWIEPHRRTPVAAAPSALHPLLHTNASDFSEQSYSATFTGSEFFLSDHQVRSLRGTIHKVLPGVAYLEMTREAIERALPSQPESMVLELRDFVWIQPVVVNSDKEVRIALMTDDRDEIEYEIYSRVDEEELVHAQGRALLSTGAAPTLDVAQLESAMDGSLLQPAHIYATFDRMGLMYGPDFQAVTSIRRGNGQAMARLRLPDGVESTAGEFVLHPSLMDGALQACLGLVGASAEALTEPQLPFALQSLRVFSPCSREMVAWVRHSPDSASSAQAAKLDIDLCDELGNVAVQMHGLSLRASRSEITAAAAQPRATGSLYATPVWQVGDVAETAPASVAYAEQHVIVCEPGSAGAALPALLPERSVTLLSAKPEQTIAQRYTEHALACFELIEAILRRRPQGKVLFQVVIAADEEHELFGGLSALLKTATLENPQFTGQMIFVAPEVSAEDLASRLRRESGQSAVIRFRSGSRETLEWQERSQGADAPPIAFRESGVYLITGGGGALGTLFANEILSRTSEARVVLAGRGSRNAEIQSDRVSFRQADVADLEQVQRLLDSVRGEFGRLDGILHCAGVTADNFILKKSAAEFAQVLASKVAGAFNLDQASRDIDLDFFVLFSSVAAATGNLGQADYATANAFMDDFAVWRNRQVAAKTRSGRTRSINWPLWLAGGMTIEPEKLELMQRTTGVRPMQTAAGIDAFYRCLALPYDRMLVAEGELTQLRRALLGTEAKAGVQKLERPLQPAAVAAGSTAERALDFLRRELSGLLKLPSHQLDPQAPLETYGIDSILAMKLTSRLEETFGSLPKTLFFEYQTLGDLAAYFAGAHASRLATLFAGADRTETVETRLHDVPAERKRIARRRFSGTRTAGRSAANEHEPIAIIGLSGRYPEAVDLEAYWNNLRDGKDCITEVPKDRWDWREFFTDDRTESGGHYSKWGGFIAGVDEFDPLFFNISPKEAKILDPQERLFLQHTWMAIEDAGYTRATLQVPDARDLPGQAGVYVGVMYVEYQLFGAAALAEGKRMGVPGSMASIANRVSYLLNLHGPSMTLDTMCSSSLTAIHLACQDLRAGRTSLGVAGGVNVSIHPNKYLVLSAGQFISSDGHCQSFGEGGDGYIPGEGVGVVVLKRLSDAKRDGDHIYGIIRGSALNHGGKTNGYTVPNPSAQASVIRRALADSGVVDARHISYIEAHGTGTKLGDPIEIAALSKAFGIEETASCLIGSAKSNIGHCESAAGIAGLTKVLLQMQHRQIVPSLHSAQLNPLIEFEKTPFVVNQSLRPWEPPVIDGRAVPRIAGISSFGAGGSNAHLIVEEYPADAVQPGVFDDVVVVLSARTAEQLRQKAQDLVVFLRSREPAIDLAAVAYTLQVGREGMDERMGVVVRSVRELIETLEAWLADRQDIEGLHQGQVKRNREAMALFTTDLDLQQAVEKWVASRKLAKLLELWVKGLEVDWSRLYGEAKPRRVSLPVYPFARERYWIDVEKRTTVAAPVVATAILHPLLHSNTSDLSEQSYRSTFRGDEFFLEDFQPDGQKILPASAYLEMARAAIEHASPERAELTILELREVVWAQPAVRPDTPIRIALLPSGEGQVEYEIYSGEGDDEVVHAQGLAVRSAPAPHALLDLAQLGRQMAEGRIEPARVYEACARMGLVYGPSYQGLQSLERGLDQVLARLELPKSLQESASGYVLHPSLLEGALQACVALLDGTASEARLPFALESLRIFSACPREMAVWARYAPGSATTGEVVRLDVDLSDAQGNVCAELRGVSWRLASAERVEPIAEPSREPARATALAPATRRELRVAAEPRAAESEKRSAISLAARGSRVLAQPAAGRAPVTIANAKTSRTASPEVLAVTLEDEGNGIVSIHIGAGAKDVAGQLRRTLERARQETSVKALLIRGLERGFLHGTREELNEAVGEKLCEAIASFPVPVIAVLEASTTGAAFLLAGLCDFMVLSEEAIYGYADAERGFSPTAVEEALFAARFGEARARDLLFLTTRATGRQLQAKGWTCPIVPAAEVEAQARKLAGTLTTKSLDALRLLKEHLTRPVATLVEHLSRVEPIVVGDAAPAGTRIEPTPHIHVDASDEQVLMLRLEEANAADLVNELREVFAQIREHGSAKAVVIASNAPEFFAEALSNDEVRELERLLAGVEIPLVAALQENARGNGWLVAQLCDAAVHNKEGIYSTAGAGASAFSLLARRFGNDAARELVLTGADYTGAALQRRTGIALVAEPDAVLSAAKSLAASWARLPRTELAAWKTRNTATLAAKPIDLQAGDAQSSLPRGSIALESPVVSAVAHPDGILVVTMADREAKNMFSEAFLRGVTEVFAHVEKTPYKVVILTGYEQYFASGGTKESLLAVQSGKAKFTDTKVFQLALDCRVPVIAAMQGHGIGAGWCLGMFADLVLLSEESRYVSPYMDYGFTPGAGATWVLAEKMGEDLARESLLTAQSYTGRELKERGLRLGITSRAGIDAAAMTLARQIAQWPRHQLVALKEQWTAPVREALEETYRRELAMHEQTFVGRDDTLAQIESQFHQESERVPVAAAAPMTPPQQQPAKRSTGSAAGSAALPAVSATLKTLLANELQMRESDIDEHTQFMDLGLDSIAGVTWIRKINETYKTALEPTKVYSYPTLAEFSRFVKEEVEKLGALPGAESDAQPVEEAPAPAAKPVVSAQAAAPQQKTTHDKTLRAPVTRLTSRRNRAASRFVAAAKTPASALVPQGIAIIGMAGQFPKAKNVQEFWQNLAEGRNCISEVPADRWDLKAHYQAGEPVAGKTYCRYFGALDEHDRFDPLFFNISPTEAEHMDPQQRLFLEACWHSIEDAGYDTRGLSGSKTGVFVGCTTSDYQEGSPAHQLSAHGFTGSATSILAARISYFLNLQGPCVSIDTACSSSLVAIAQACDSLTSGTSDLALAAGVYVMGGPGMHIRSSQTGMLSPEGKCFSFDQRADGFVPGEAVGVVMLKRLADAERDRDVIYGVVQGWGVNQDGRTNGITSPNPESQTRLEQEVYDRYGIDPAHLQLVEAHGTGTKLGDPIEAEGLKQAFKKYTQKKEYCALGSVKSNIGHCLTAAGVAGVIKILLALQHRKLPPTINFERLNEHIDLKDSPFYVNTRLQEWELQGAPRRQAAISSFGFSGTNAHLVIGEYERPSASGAKAAFVMPPDAKTVVPLSARTAEQLKQKAKDLLQFLRTKAATPDLTELAYTLQTGRAPMDERLGFVVSSVAQLTEKLQAYVEGEARIEDVYQGHAKRNKEALSLLTSDSDLRKTIDQWIVDRKLAKLTDLWTKGLDFEWSALYGEARPQRISLPVYPFAKERYRIEPKAVTPGAPVAASVLHPLLHSNVSVMNEQRYRSTFSGTEFFADHRVALNGSGNNVLPAAAYLEMVRAAMEHAFPAHPKSTGLELRDTLWGAPFIANVDHAIDVALLTNDEDGVAFEIYSRDADQDVVHCQGRAIVTDESMMAGVDLQQIRARMAGQELPPDSVYASSAGRGIEFGPAFRALTSVWRGEAELLARLRLPADVAATAGEYVIHPSLVQCAMEAALLLCGGGPALTMQSLRVGAPCTAEMFAWARYAATDGSVTVDLCDATGKVCVQVRGLSPRTSAHHLSASIERSEDVRTLLVAPAWKADAIDHSHGAVEFVEHHVLLCDFPGIETEGLRATVHVLTTEGNLAARYTELALTAFEQIQSILQRKPDGKVLFQIVMGNRDDDAPLAGLFAMLKTAGQESPNFVGQVFILPHGTTTPELATTLEEEKRGGLDALIRYELGERQILRWAELPAEPAPAPIAFRKQGVYLITGGTGGLGVVFAREILAQSEATVVLTGRSPWTKEVEESLTGLSAVGGRLCYRQLDLTDAQQVADVIAGIRGEYGPLHGIVHCAGMIADNFIVKKTRAEFARVLAPKVSGTCNLDEATRDLELDFFVLFSSVAGVFGNAAQADYAAANAFMDQFAVNRNRQVLAKLRHGRTRSINWPLWQAGRMSIDAAAQERLKEGAGLVPMPTANGIQAFHRSLASPSDQLLVLEGIPAKVTAYLRKVRVFEAPVHPVATQPAEAPSIEQLHQDLKAILAAVLKVEGATIDIDQPFVEFGLDSFLGAELMASINKKFGTELAQIVVFDHPTVRELAAFLEKQLTMSPRRIQAAPVPAPALSPSSGYPTLKKIARTGRVAGRQELPRDERVAIIGMSGRYPKASNLGEYWDHLAAGRNCVTEVPASRWDVNRFYDPARIRKNSTYSKWLGAIDDVDCFDPLFFRISPNEAEHIDPQHRLFLQESYRAFEDAGYSPDALANKKCGVYLGISTNEYVSLLTQNPVLSAPVTSNSNAIAAARIAYYLNLKGPAIAVDTACSSALVAIHLACQAIARGEIDFALAGGVSLWLTPGSYVAMSQAGMFSPTGQCKTFDDSADGIVNGDGVGAVVLKRLEDAERDRDFIYGVILGSGINQDGKTNGITAPSVASQIELERGIYAKYGIDPETITYVEAHGTGTKLGDPIELEALATVFQEKTDKKRFCALGSAKSNIGHTTSAAGVAGVHKVLLSMQHRTLVPTLNVTKETTRFDFANSPFYLSRETQPWTVAPGSLRRAAVSSFGFSGTNAHLVIEEYVAPAAPALPVGESPAYIVPLSARTPEQLRQRSRDLLAHLVASEQPIDLAAVAYTLQIGREPMEERVGFVVSSVEQLTERLRAFVEGDKNIDGFCRGRVDAGGEGMAVVGRDEDMQEAIGKWIARRKLAKLLDLWVRGVSFDWNELYGGVLPRRISLPAYPFRKDRCWIDSAPAAEMLDIRLASDETMQSIDDILNQIGADMIETDQAIAALKMLV